ncbi:unnamed protein product [Bemisia tabaci]|uniref:Uncharacterized protein n=1 Tax=Bemisia tabaci TaxID=7038 RepID=A0A9P0A9G3_BEMTA|nr:unnamed protein product [Bemisia tabaci]
MNSGYPADTMTESCFIIFLVMFKKSFFQFMELYKNKEVMHASLCVVWESDFQKTICSSPVGGRKWHHLLLQATILVTNVKKAATMSSTARSFLSQMMSKNVVSKFTWMGVADDKLSFIKHGLKLVLIECLVLLYPAETGHQGQISKSIGQWFTQFSAEEQGNKAVKACPFTSASAMYYKTKLLNHNYTVYDLSSHECICYWFNETAADLSAPCI